MTDASPQRHAAAGAVAIERRLRDALRAEPDIRWAYLFGSCARGQPFRDVDLAVVLVPSARGAVALGRVVVAAESAAAGVPVDVVDLLAAAPRLAGVVVREGHLLVDREPATRRDWEVDANRLALDIEPWLVEFERLSRAALRERAG